MKELRNTELKAYFTSLNYNNNVEKMFCKPTSLTISKLPILCPNNTM